MCVLGMFCCNCHITPVPGVSSVAHVNQAARRMETNFPGFQGALFVCFFSLLVLQKKCLSSLMALKKCFFVLTGAAKVSSAFLVSSLDSVSLFPCFFLVGQGTPNPWCLMILCVFFYILFCVSLKKERNNKRKKEKQTLCQEWCVLQGGRKEAKRDGKKQGEKTREKERRKENQEERRKQGDRQIKKLE